MKDDSFNLFDAVFIIFCFCGFWCWSQVTEIPQDHDTSPAEQIRLCVWYYDICNDSETNPKHEAWTDHGKAQLTEWVRVKFPVELIDELPGDVGEWVRRVKNG